MHCFKSEGKETFIHTSNLFLHLCSLEFKTSLNSDVFTLCFSFKGVSLPLEEPHLPAASLAVRAAAQLTEPADHDYVTSMLAAWGQLLVSDLVSTANGNQVTLFSKNIIYVDDLVMVINGRRKNLDERRTT